MHDPSKELFENYGAFYERSQSDRQVERLPAELEKLRRDRLPQWIDNFPLNARILDAGCAQGHFLAALARVGYQNLHGVDISAQLLESARQRLPHGVTLKHADIIEYLDSVEPNSFDLVFFHAVLEHLPRSDILRVLRGFYRVLTPNGCLRLLVPNMSALIAGYTAAIDFTHVTFFSEYSLRQVLEAAGFDSENVVIENKGPRLFWSWRSPVRAVFRLLNRGRWHANNAMHRIIYLLSDIRPRPTVFDPDIVVVAQK